MESNHYVSELKREQVRRSLKERPSLYAISRIFELSYTWVYNFAKATLAKTPDSLDAKSEAHTPESTKELQEAGIQLDEA